MNLSRRFLVGGVPTVVLAAVLCAAGSWSGRAQSPDQTTLPPVTPGIQVSLVVKVPKAYAAAGIPGSFTVSRVGGSALEDVTVSYQVSGQAVAGQDYKALKGTKTIPATKSKVQIMVNPIAVAGSGGTVKGVRVTLLPGEGYSLTTAVKGTVKIVQ